MKPSDWKTGGRPARQASSSQSMNLDESPACRTGFSPDDAARVQGGIGHRPVGTGYQPGQITSEHLWPIVAADLRRRIPVMVGATIRLVTSKATHPRFQHHPSRDLTFGPVAASSIQKSLNQPQPPKPPMHTRLKTPHFKLKPLGLLDRLPSAWMAALQLFGGRAAIVRLMADYSSALPLARAGINNS